MRMMLLAVVCVVLLIPVASYARTWHVRQDGSGDCMTIQACVNLAGTGDSIIVAPGTYQEHISIHTPISLISEAGAASTTVDGTQSGRCIYLNSIPLPGVLIKGLTVWNGNLSYSATWEGDVGAGIFCKASYFEIRENVILGNRGGGIACDASSSGTITGNEIRDNTGGDVEEPYPILGVGIETRSSNIIVEGNLIKNNSDDAIYIYHCSPTVRGNTLFGNSSIKCVRCNSLITENTITHNRGGIYVYESSASPAIVQNTIVDNTLSAVKAGNGASPSLMSNIIACNFGEGVYCYYGSVTLGCNDVWGNQVNYSKIGCIIDSTGDFHLDPLFCNRPSWDYTLSCYSPCANRLGCGRVGALPVACGPTSITATSWGRVKSMFR